MLASRAIRSGRRLASWVREARAAGLGPDDIRACWSRPCPADRPSDSMNRDLIGADVHAPALPGGDRGAGLRYGRTWALRGCSPACPGRVAALVGPNGAGKSSLMRLAVGLRRPDGRLRRTRRPPRGSEPDQVAFVAQDKPLSRAHRRRDDPGAGAGLNPTSTRRARASGRRSRHPAAPEDPPALRRPARPGRDRMAIAKRPISSSSTSPGQPRPARPPRGHGGLMSPSPSRAHRRAALLASSPSPGRGHHDHLIDLAGRCRSRGHRGAGVRASAAGGVRPVRPPLAADVIGDSRAGERQTTWQVRADHDPAGPPGNSPWRTWCSAISAPRHRPGPRPMAL